MTAAASVPPAAGRTRVRRVLLAALAVVVALVVVAAGAVALLARALAGDLAREDVFGGIAEDERPEQEPTEALDLLVLGSDGRAGAGEAYETGDNADVAGERADTTLLVHISADRESARVVSLPRDSWVALPACRGTDGAQLPARQGQLNAAFLEGGLPCAVRTVEALTGVRIDHTAVVDFAGFRDMVDALGGVPVCLDEPFRPRMAGVDLPAGRSVLQGPEALEFVRARYGVGDGTDTDRIERQKQVIASMLDRALSRDLLVRPDRLVRFLSAATRNLRVDEELDLRELALSLRGVDLGLVALTTVPLDPEPGPEFAEGGALFGRLAWDEPAAAALFAELRTDQPPAPAPPTPSGAASGAPVTPTPAASSDVTTAADTACR